MNWYLTFIDLLIYAFVVVMARHLFLRGAYFLHIFQLKGYKFNEYWHWLLDHWNQRVLTLEHVLFNVIILVMLAFMSDTVTGSAAIVILCMFGFFWFGPFNYYRGERQKKPLVFTPRMIRLTIPFVLMGLFIPAVSTLVAHNSFFPLIEISETNPPLFSWDIYILSFGWVLADVVLPFLVFPAGLLMLPVEKSIHSHFIRMAKEKLADMPGLTVIAITGSYGKTSTKFMIRDLLNERFRVCATPGSYNTPMGICKVINNKLNANHQVLVLEMGARYEGNIDELCDIVQPDIAVITNVGIAHLETFGSREAIARTKATLVRRLLPGGRAVLNADDPLVNSMADLRNDIEIIKTGIENGSVTASDIRYDHQGTHFKVHLPDGTSEQFETRLLGAHNVQNMLLAVAVASHFGIRLKTMALAASGIKPVEHRLELKKQGEITVIDDAFNSNPVGARNAVEILSRFETGKRIIITPGMIELGALQEEENKKFGKTIGEANLDLVILVGQNQTKPIREGIRETGYNGERVRTVDSLFEANRIVEEFAKPGDVILYENDLPDTYEG